MDSIITNYRVQVDHSGVGHCWSLVNDDTMPAHIAAEIATEIIDGRQETCEDYVASNGQHYRWGIID